MTNLVTRVAQIFADFFGHFEKCHFLNKNYFGYFLATTINIGQLIIFNIWSHWIGLPLFLIGAKSSSHDLWRRHLHTTSIHTYILNLALLHQSKLMLIWWIFWVLFWAIPTYVLIIQRLAERLLHINVKKNKHKNGECG